MFIMKCPYCNKEMEKGYIYKTDLFHNLKWCPEKNEGHIFVNTKRDVRLTYDGQVTAYRCEDCKKIIIDENTLKA